MKWELLALSHFLSQKLKDKEESSDTLILSYKYFETLEWNLWIAFTSLETIGEVHSAGSFLMEVFPPSLQTTLKKRCVRYLNLFLHLRLYPD